jgi:hypothetical protein
VARRPRRPFARSLWSPSRSRGSRSPHHARRDARSAADVLRYNRA